MHGYGVSDLLVGGEGNDVLNGSYGNDFLIGGHGDDNILGSKETGVIAFNRGDGRDVLSTGDYYVSPYSSAGKGATLSLGGIRYADLALKKSSNDLILEIGQGEQVKFEN